MNLKDIIFAPRYTQEQLSVATDWLTNPSIKASYRYAANFAIICDGRNEAYDFLDQPCHREIQGNNLPLRSLVATECGWERRHDKVGMGNRELFEPFFNWFTKDSFAARFIIWSSLDDGFVVSADMYTPLLQNIMIMSRHFFEVHEKAFSLFNKLIEDGVPGDIAYPFAFNSSLSEPGAVPTAKFVSKYGHRVTHLFGVEEFKNWLQGDLGKELKDNVNDYQEHYRYRRNYMGGRNLFWNTNVEGYATAFINKLVNDLMTIKEFRDGLSSRRQTQNKEMYRAPNPFAPKPVSASLPSANEISNEEAVEFAIPFITELLKPYWNRT